MTSNTLEKIIASHKNKGLIENSDRVVVVDNSLVKYNCFTLKLKRLPGSHIDLNNRNAIILKYVKQNSNLYKEIREFNLLFRFLKKLNVYDGHVKKSETPDFEMIKNGRTYGIEVTRIYTGSDWVAEKIHNDIEAYKLSGPKLTNYLSTVKQASRINTTGSKKVVVRAIKETQFKDIEINSIKNKLFEKIRKQIDDYTKFDSNYIFAEVVFTGYKELKDIDKLNDEIRYYVSHLEPNWGHNEFHLILKIGNVFIDFDIKSGSYTKL